MKTTVFSIMLCLFWISLFAQVPQKMSYQAMIRNSNDKLVTNHTVGMRTSILKDSTTGTLVYREYYKPNPQTNANGLVTLEIGAGIPVSGTFASIDWSAGPYFLMTETDPAGGKDYTITVTSQLLSVPYALYSKTAGNGFSGDYNDLTNKPVILNNTLYTTATGYKALNVNSGVSNTANGFMALFSNTTGYNNTALGYQAGYLNPSGSGNVFIGSNAGCYETGSNKLIIDNLPRAGETDARAKALIYGEFDADPANQTLTINGKINANTHQIINVANPVNPQDAVTKAYVEKLLNDLGIIPNNFAGTMKDIEGNAYKTVQIGDQTWMAENLKTTKYNDGSTILNITYNPVWLALTAGAYCWYNNDINNRSTLGALYNWYAVNTGKLCPEGWHVPSDAEWTVLVNYLIANGYNYDGTTSDNKIAKSMAATTNWNSSTITGAIGNNLSLNNKSGFSGLPGGYRFNDGTFSQVGNYGLWWSSMEFSEAYARDRSLYSGGTDAYRGSSYKNSGYSVRCVRD